LTGGFLLTFFFESKYP
jgi:hypothetical protein